MNLICSREELLNNINIVMKAVSTKTTLPILECILIIADENGFKLMSNDLEMGIETKSIEANIINNGKVAIEARIFSEIIRKVNGEEVEIICDENNYKITIKSGTSIFNISGQSGEDFPLLPVVDKNNEYKLFQADLRDMIRQTIFSIAQDETRPILAGELLEINSGYISMVSVDGYRISYKKTYLLSSTEDNSVIVPGKTLNEISKILNSDGEESVTLYFTDKHIIFETDKFIIVSRLIEGEYIKYAQSFTDDYKTRIIISRIELLSSLERATLVSRESKKTPIRFNIQHGDMEISSNAEMGSLNEMLSIDCEGDDIKIAFNPKYLIDALKAIEDDNILIQFNTSLSPCIIRPTEGSEYKYLILPLRV